MSHLVAVDNPWCVVDMTAVSQRNLNLIQCGSWKTRSRNDFLIPSNFLNNSIDKGGLTNIGHADHINISAFPILLNLFNQFFNRLLVLS